MNASATHRPRTTVLRGGHIVSDKAVVRADVRLSNGVVAGVGKLDPEPGSDGIFIGAHPHPRAHGTFTRYLREIVREEGFWTWPEAVAHLSTGPVSTYALGTRGRIEVGCVADVIVVDPATVTDHATYRHPTQLSTGIDDVFVAGERVLATGQLTQRKPGGGLRRAHR